MVQINLRVRESVARALRTHALAETGHMKGMSEIADRILSEYFQEKGLIKE